MANWKNKKTEELIDTLLTLTTRKQAESFLRDLMTESEIVEFGNRWKAARMLAANEPYTTITQETGLSSRTIARINKWLKAGMGGYRSLIASTAHHRNHIRSSPGAACVEVRYT